jgi:hypothetical protein
MFLIPCSCDLTFAVPENFDQREPLGADILPAPDVEKGMIQRIGSCRLGIIAKDIGGWKSAEF